MKTYLLNRKAISVSDDSSLVIWTYMNLFIGFIIIFLSGIATNPGNSFEQNNQTNNLNFLDQRIFDTPMIVAYDKFDIELIMKDIETFSRAQKLSLNSRIAYLQVIGPYDSTTETKADGLRRAQAISLRLNSSRTNMFRNASTTLSVSNGIPINRFVLKITFSTSN